MRHDCMADSRNTDRNNLIKNVDSILENDRDKNRDEKGRTESVQADSKNAVILLLYVIITL